MEFRKQYFKYMAVNGYGTHFLTKNDAGEMFVVILKNTSSGFQALVKPLNFPFEFSNEFKYRFVIPSMVK